jgi:hypothetical protein
VRLENVATGDTLSLHPCRSHPVAWEFLSLSRGDSVRFWLREPEQTRGVARYLTPELAP